jgi:Cupin
MPATILETGDLVLFPAMPGFTLRSDPKAPPLLMKPAPSEEQVEEIFHGDATAEPSVSLLGGYFAFDPIMLLSFLPKMLRLRATDPAIDSVAVVVERIQREARVIRRKHANYRPDPILDLYSHHNAASWDYSPMTMICPFIEGW